MKSISFFSFVFLFVFFACKDSGVSPCEFKSGTYNYISYDTLGIMATTGSLILSRSDSKISGTWNFNDGRSGNLVGKIDKDSIELYLYPGGVDHYLTLMGKFSNNIYTGKWILYGWGIRGKGTFKAQYQMRMAP